MNLQDPISSIMTTSLKTLSPNDKLQAVKDLFESFPIHHIPVVEEEKLVGIISKVDYLYFLRPYSEDNLENYNNEIRLKNYTLGEMMTKRVVTISSTATIQSALEVLTENLFHALPVVDSGKLVGMMTTHDVIFRLLHPKQMIATD